MIIMLIIQQLLITEEHKIGEVNLIEGSEDSTEEYTVEVTDTSEEELLTDSEEEICEVEVNYQAEGLIIEVVLIEAWEIITEILQDLDKINIIQDDFFQEVEVFNKGAHLITGDINREDRIIIEDFNKEGEDFKANEVLYNKEEADIITDKIIKIEGLIVLIDKDVLIEELIEICNEHL